MEFYEKDKINKIPLLAVSSGTPVTGLTDADIVLYRSVNGGIPTPVIITGVVTELDPTNMPGAYSIDVPSSVFNDFGTVILYFSGIGFDNIAVVGNVGLIDFIKDIRAFSAQIGYKIVAPVYSVDGDLESAVLQGFEPGDDPDIDAPRATASITATYNPDRTLASYKVEEP